MLNLQRGDQLIDKSPELERERRGEVSEVGTLGTVIVRWSESGKLTKIDPELVHEDPAKVGGYLLLRREER
jgi:hypothetical protein